MCVYISFFRFLTFIGYKNSYKILTIVSSAVQQVLVLFSLYLVLFQRYKRYNLLLGFDRKSQESYFLSPERLLDLKFCPSQTSSLGFQPLLHEASKFGNCLTEEDYVLEKGPLTLVSFCFLSTMERQDRLFHIFETFVCLSGFPGSPLEIEMSTGNIWPRI